MGVAPRQRPEQQPEKPRASWSSRTSFEGGKRHGEIYHGVFVDAGKDPEFDLAAQGAGWNNDFLKVDRNKDAVEVWIPPSPTIVHVLIEEAPRWEDGTFLDRISDYVDQNVWEYGVGARWPKKPQGSRGIRPRSSLGVWVLFHDLLPFGYEEPISFVVTSTNTEDLISCFIKHQKLVSWNNAQTQVEDRFADVGLPLIVGKEKKRSLEYEGSTAYRIACAHPQREAWSSAYVENLLSETDLLFWKQYLVDEEQTVDEWARSFAEPLVGVE